MSILSVETIVKKIAVKNTFIRNNE